MSRLTQIYKKVFSNMNAYLLDKNKIDLLAENIKLFEEIPDSYLKKLFKTSPAFVFAENNETLLMVGYSYIYYGQKNKENLSLNELINLLEKGKHCFQRTIDYYENLPPSQIEAEHSEQLLIAHFELHKIKFLKAEMRLLFIEQEIKTGITNIAFTRKELAEIIEEFTLFRNILGGQYKDSALREKLSINKKLLNSIQEGLKKAKNLSDTLPQQHSTKRHLSETNAEEKNSQESRENSSKIKRKRLTVKKNKPKTTSSNQQSNSDNGNIEFEENGLDILSTTAFDVAPMETPVELNDLPIFQPDLVPQVILVQPLIPKSVEDSKKLLTGLESWLQAYSSTRIDISQVKRVEISFEKIAHSLLHAAVTLQKESSVFKDQKFNPVIQTAVQLLLYTSSKVAQNNSEAAEKLSYLSTTYAPLLKPFVRPFFHMTPEKFISHLRMQFAAQNPSNISFRNLEIPEIVEQLIKHFETTLTADDYEKVIRCCNDCFEQARIKLTEQNTVPFNMSFSK